MGRSSILSLHKRAKTGHVPGDLSRGVKTEMLERPKSKHAKSFKKDFVKHANRKVRRARIVLADTTVVDVLRPYVNKILRAIGYPKALVTDESFTTDFCDLDETRSEFLARVSQKLGIPVDKEPLAVTALRLKSIKPMKGE